jgi:hypothetical protein
MIEERDLTMMSQTPLRDHAIGRVLPYTAPWRASGPILPTLARQKCSHCIIVLPDSVVSPSRHMFAILSKPLAALQCP